MGLGYTANLKPQCQQPVARLVHVVQALSITGNKWTGRLTVSYQSRSAVCTCKAATLQNNSQTVLTLHSKP